MKAKALIRKEFYQITRDYSSILIAFVLPLITLFLTVTLFECQNASFVSNLELDIMASLTFKKDRTLKSTEKGFLQATEIADYLAMKNIPFRTAHGIVQQIVHYCIDNNKTLDKLSVAEYQKFSKEIKEDLYKFIDVKNIVNAKTSYGGTSKKSILKQISDLKKLVRVK